MRIDGYEKGLTQEEVSIPRGDGKEIKLILTALPIGFIETTNTNIPSPKPRTTGFAKKPGGGVLIGPNRQPVVETDENTPEYKRKENRANQLQAAVIIAKGLEGDEKVSFETRPDGENWEEYAEGILEEMKEFGFSHGDFNLLMREILRVSNLSKKKLDEIQEVF